MAVMWRSGRLVPDHKTMADFRKDNGSVARYLHQLDSAGRQEPSLAQTLRTTRLKEKIERLKEEMGRWEALEAEGRERPDQQISPTDPDARSMATSGRGSGPVGYTKSR